MATAKKTAAKTTKKPVVKKAPSRPVAKTSVKRVAKKKNEVKSFAVSRPTEPFFTFRITHQTLYWLVLSLFVLALGLWVININDKVQRIYDEIDRTNAEERSIVIPSKKVE